MTLVIVLCIASALAGAAVGRQWSYTAAFDDGWVHCHLGGLRQPWRHGQAWRGNGLSPAELDALGRGESRPLVQETHHDAREDR